MNFSRLWQKYWHLVLFVFATAITMPFYHADIREYCEQILAHENGEIATFWEFGHLLLRPFASLLWHAFGNSIGAMFGYDEFTQIAAILVGLAWVCGVLAVQSMRSILERLGLKGAPQSITLIAFIFASAFLNFSQAGTSYVPGLAFVLLSLSSALSAGSGLTVKTGFFAAIAVGFWATYVWFLPAIVLAPQLLKAQSFSWTNIIRNGALILGPVAILFSIGALLQGVSSVTEARLWISSASHGDQRGGPTRMILGLARSFVFMGDTGMLVRRYQVGDPYNPVTLVELIGTGLWKLIAFYLVAIAAVVRVAVSEDRKRQLWLCIALAPVLVFGASWDGAAVERYLPLFPGFFILIALASRSGELGKYACGAFAILLIVVNGWSTFAPRASRASELTAAPVEPVVESSRAGALFIVLNLQDDLLELKRNHPFHELVRSQRFQTYPVLADFTLTGSVPLLGSRIRKAWDEGVQVWVRKALFHAVPDNREYWVEDQYAETRWTDLNAIISQLETNDSLHGEFALLKPTARNVSIITDWMARTRRTDSARTKD